MKKLNIIRIAFLLILTIVALPFIFVKLNFQVSPFQWTLIRNSFFIVLGISLACFALAEATGNCSQVDKIWSIMPVIYSWYFAYNCLFEPRSILMAVCVTIWGARLTYNFSRHVAYRIKFWEGKEDYRWEILRQKPFFSKSKLSWTIFNLVFISFYQNTLIWLITLPAVFAHLKPTKPLGTTDILLTVVLVGLIVVETVADQQQWNFQREKSRRIKAHIPPDGNFAKGFISTGLWRYMRHPNYFAEQALWVTFYFFSVRATGSWLNAGCVGALLLLLLFQGSAAFSEEISISKYPAFEEYRRKTGKFLPKWH